MGGTSFNPYNAALISTIGGLVLTVEHQSHGGKKKSNVMNLRVTKLDSIKIKIFCKRLQEFRHEHSGFGYQIHAVAVSSSMAIPRSATLGEECFIEMVWLLLTFFTIGSEIITFPFFFTIVAVLQFGLRKRRKTNSD